MFRTLLGHLQALRETNPRTVYISMHCGIPQCIEIWIALGFVALISPALTGYFEKCWICM